MPDQVDASTLADETRVRRTELAAAYTEALRTGDDKAKAELEKAIKAEYADDAKPAPKAAATKE